MPLPSKQEMLEEFVAENEIIGADVLEVFLANACKHDLAWAVKRVGEALYDLSLKGELDKDETSA